MLKIEKLLHNQCFFFDLDKTIWNTVNKYGKEIWAKQMLQPFTKLSTNRVEDDVGSICTLDYGLMEVLDFLKQNNKEVYFLSIGGIDGCPLNYQPSYNLLQTFGLLDFFHSFGHSRLFYKTASKMMYLRNFKNQIVLFDDDNEVLNSVQQLNNVTAIDRKKFDNWRQLL